MPNYVDLHMHTTYSDGLQTPDQLLDLVRSRELAAFAVSDHDSVGGSSEIRSLLKVGDPELITGVELSCSVGDSDLHMLGYLFDHESVAMDNALVSFREKRNRRARTMVDKLRSLGVDICFDDVEKYAAGGAIGRPHVAEAIYQCGAVGSYEEAFEKYIKDKGPAYVPKENFSPEDAIALVRGCGGVTVLAHPMINENHKHIEMLANLGLDGIEIYHPSHKKRDTDWLRCEAGRFGLLVSGGSDFHGRDGRYSTVGSQKVPVDCLEKMKALAGKRQCT